MFEWVGKKAAGECRVLSDGDLLIWWGGRWGVVRMKMYKRLSSLVVVGDGGGGFWEIVIKICTEGLNLFDFYV